MNKLASLIVIIGLIILSLISCGSDTSGGSIGTGVSNPPTTTEQSASAVGAVFSASSSNNNISEVVRIPKYILDLAINQALAQQQQQQCDANDEACTCTYVEENGSDEITQTANGAAGTYGSAGTNVTLTDDDFCKDSDGNTNSGGGPDGNGRFATFTLSSAVSGTCTQDGTTRAFSMTSGSSGIWRNTVASGSTPAYEPQIFGTFGFISEGVTSTYNCTIYLGSDETFLFSECTDENDIEVDQTTDATCEVGSSS